MTLSILRTVYFCCGRSIQFGSVRVSILEDLSIRNHGIFSSARLLSSSSSSSSSDSSSDSSDEEDKTKEKSKEKSSVQNKLNMLLKSMPKENSKGEIKPGFSGHFYKDVGKAAEKVAESIGGDVKKTQSELLNRLLNRVEEKTEKTESAEGTKTSVNLSELFEGMKIDRTPNKAPDVRSRRSISEELFVEQQASGFRKRERFDPTQRRPSRDKPGARMPLAKVDLFGSPALGIFQKSEDLQELPELSTWRHLQERELRLSVTHPPANIYEEMMMWTNKGTFWKFPINNEQGLEAEAEISFTEHVFLDVYLDPWCPPKGPIRHFMELVCVGLSKNHYFTAEQKKEHMLWYRDYFIERISKLEQVGLSLNVETEKRIE